MQWCNFALPLSDARPMVGKMHFHPWREVSKRSDITILWDDSEDEYGSTHFATRCITLSRHMTEVERRCTLTHELIHLERGAPPKGYAEAEEVVVRSLTARRLIPIDRLIDGLLWSRDEHELAEELWVDVETVRDRLSTLSEDDRVYIEHELDHRETAMP